MSSRGRGYSRGSRGGGSYRGSSSSYRGLNSSHSSGGYNSSSRGGGSRYNGNDYDSRNSSRYSNTNSSDRYRDSYKRSSGGYSGSRDRTPDRKRSRNDQGSRRSHDYGGSGDFSSRSYESSSYDNKRDGRNGRSRSSPSQQSSTSRFRSHNDDRRHKEPMGPPKTLPPRLTSRRGSTYRPRGRFVSSRGVRSSRGITRRNDLRRRPFISSKSRDYARRIKIARLRSSIKKRSLGSRSSEDKKDKKRSISDKDEDKKKSSKKDKDDDEKIETKSDAGNEETPKKKSKKEKTESGDDEEAEVASEKEDDDAEGDKRSKKEGSSETLPKSRYTGKSFIKLTCIHCNSKCLTFKEYSNHLHGRTHKVAMRRLSLKQKAQLSRMRQDQRNVQRDIEIKSEDNETRSQFCLLCRLNYRQPKVKHQLSQAHRNMKKFLMPYCRLCRIVFKSPMIYEAHRCSLEHIKRKARNLASKSDSGGEDEKHLDLENFMTVDSVGDVDGADIDMDDMNDENGEKKDDVNVGMEYIKKVEAYYCELCRVHLAQHEEYDIVVRRHCQTRLHLRGYLQHREDKTLRKAAEKIHRKHQETKGNKDQDNKDGDSEIAAEKKENDGEGDTNDKMWADVDKDLGELLGEVRPENGNADEDDEEDSRMNAERYDRFKNSEKLNLVTDKDVVVDDKIEPTVLKEQEENVLDVEVKNSEKNEEVETEATVN